MAARTRHLVITRCLVIKMPVIKMPVIKTTVRAVVPAAGATGTEHVRSRV